LNSLGTVIFTVTQPRRTRKKRDHGKRPVSDSQARERVMKRGQRERNEEGPSEGHQQVYTWHGKYRTRLLASRAAGFQSSPACTPATPSEWNKNLYWNKGVMA
jgi:hypothetical protein